LGRVEQILEAFSAERRTISLHQLSALAQLPKSTTHRFAEQMVQLGWLERRFDGYSIGNRLYELGERSQSRGRIRVAAAPYLSAVSTKLGMYTYLSVLDRTDVLCIDWIAAPGGSRAPSTRWRVRIPALTTSLGTAIVAFEPDDVIADIVNETCALTPPAGTRDELLRELARVREAGSAASLSRRSRRWIRGMPLRNSGRAIASIAVAGPKSEIDSPRVELEMRSACRQIWHDLFRRD
jgi:DNA-binding IclR family transcriptional regulator